MKRTLFFIVMLAGLLLIPAVSAPIEESTLGPEIASRPDPKADIGEEPTMLFHGYANSKDVTVVGGVIGCVYYFCSKPGTDFCSDQEGILVVSGADSGKEPEMLKKLDVALENNNEVIIKLALENPLMGVKKILDVKLLN